MSVKHSKTPTILGIFSVVFWSTSVAFSRSAAEKMGTLNMAFFNLLISSFFLLLFQLAFFKKEFFLKITKIPLAYFYKVGSYMIIYIICFYMAVGEASNRESVIVIGIINYLWPGLTFLFSIPILRNKAKISLLISGTMSAFAGTTLAFIEGYHVSLAELKSTLQGDLIPFLYAFIAAVSWAIYSNMTRKHQRKEDQTVMPILLLTAGIIVLLIQLLQGKTPELKLTGLQWLELAYLAIFPTALAYLFWDRAMKQGNKNLVTAFSYTTPLTSTLISGFYLQVTIGIGFGLAAVLVIIGAVLCRQSMINPSHSQ
jgi:drug/metabolite transporter (DMT)-like permease